MTEYNGWTNYETWCVNLWLNNEEWTYFAIREQAKETTDLYELAEWVRIFTENSVLYDMPISGLGADLLNSALSEVDWYEIAEGFKEE